MEENKAVLLYKEQRKRLSFTIARILESITQLLFPSSFRDQLLSLSKFRLEAVPVWLETFYKLLSRAAKALSNGEISTKCRIPDCVDESLSWLPVPLEEGR